MNALSSAASWEQGEVAGLGGQPRTVPRSRLAALAALGLAFAAHASFAFWGASIPVEQAGGNTALAGQGNSFADMAAGVQTPEPPSEVERDQEPEKLAAVAPTTPAQPQQPARAEGMSPAKPVSAQQPVAQSETTAAEAQPSAQFPVSTQAPSQKQVTNPVTPLAAVPEGVSLLAVTVQDPPDLVAKPSLQVSLQLDAVSRPPPLEPVPLPSAKKPSVQAPPEPAPTQPRPQQALKPEPAKLQPPEPQSPEVKLSLRPPERPEVVAQPVQKAPPPSVSKPVVQEARKPASKPQGSGDKNATRGVAQSRRQQSGGQANNTAGQAKVQGNAAADNYAGLVMRRLQRAKRRASVKGVAMVRFSITPGGGLAGVSIARSSGSGKLDEIALAQVRRAGPFPAPPAGARTTFTVRIKGN